MLPKIRRLTKRGSFAYIYKNGQKKHDSVLSLIYIRSKSLKIGFSVNNKIGKAVVRNKLKRRLRAIVRPLLNNITPVQAVLAVKPGADKLDFAALKEGVEALFLSAGLIKKVPKC